MLTMIGLQLWTARRFRQILADFEVAMDAAMTRALAEHANRLRELRETERK